VAGEIARSDARTRVGHSAVGAGNAV